MNSNRASKGGQIGMNGEHYAGGTFLPRTKLTKMARRTNGGTGKQEVAPYKWEVAPADRMVSLYRQFSTFINMQTGEVNEVAARYYNRDAAVIAKQFAAWKAGIMWIAA